MLAPYRRILSVPGTMLFSLTGLVARLPISMVGLGVVLLVSERTGSYGLAGTVSAATVVASAVGSPLQGRLTDRFGQSRVLPVTAGVFAAGMTAMLTSIGRDWPLPLPHVFGAITGLALPQIGSMVRARWTHALDDRQMLQTAFAFEAVVAEMTFILGPVLVTFLATLWHPFAGLICAGVTGLGGALLLAAQHRTDPRFGSDEDHPLVRHKLGWRLLAPLVLAAVGLGSVFGAMEVVTVALTQLRVMTTVLALAFGPLTLGGPLALATPLLFVCGLTVSPSLIALTSLVERGVPRERLTEGLAWSMTGLAAGVAPGAAVSGWTVDVYGASVSYLVCLSSAALSAAVAWSIGGRVGPAAVVSTV